jgi:ParB family chromosome partitioning protein
MVMDKRGLGRGLGALIPETSAFSHAGGDTVLSLPIGSVQPNPAQPRREFAPEDLDGLADSIRARGLLQPIVVRKRGEDTYQLIAGERRWRAAARAGFEHIPAILRESKEDEMLLLALIENVQRENLNPIEEAGAYRQLGEQAGWTQDEIAQHVGKGRTHVANTVRLLKLPPAIQGDVASGRLSAGHARAVLACSTESEMLALRDRILSEELTVRQTEETSPTKKRKRKRASGAAARDVSPETRDLEERLQRVYGTPVQIHERDGRGRVSLEFYSFDDLDRLTELLFAAGIHPPD